MISNPRPAKKIGTLVTLAIALFVLAGLILVSFRPRPASPQNQLSWLTTGELARPKPITPFTQFKFRVLRLTAPVWQRFVKNRPQITIEASVLKLSATAPGPIDFIPPFATAANGTRAWILSPQQIRSVRAQLAALPEAAVVAAPRCITGDGIVSRLSMENSFSIAGHTESAGLFLWLRPGLAYDKVALTVDLQQTEAETNPAGIALIKTNQAYACQAVFQNEGGLLLENPSPDTNSPSRFWLVLTARAVDAKGRLLGR
jgi:hypothetical protein